MSVALPGSGSQTAATPGTPETTDPTADSFAYMASGSMSRIFKKPTWYFKKRVVMQQARELFAIQAGDAAGRAKAMARLENPDQELSSETAGSVLQILMGDADATLDDIAKHYSRKFRKADALEQKYHSTEGGTSLLRKAAKIRSQALTELGFLGVDPQSIGEGGLRAMQSSLNASEIARCFGKNAKAIGIALSISTNMSAHINALSTTLNELASALRRQNGAKKGDPV